MIGKVLKGLYKIYDEIGSGGLATVYLARNVQTNQIVAVKVLHAHVADDPDTRSRFAREADLLGGLDDLHFVRLFDHGQEGAQPFLVMEFVEGSTLKALIKEKGRLPVTQSLYIARRVAEGLAAIHRRGVIHRDIKPQNIMVKLDGSVKVMDFGIAKSMDMNTLTNTGFMVGTPHYIAPEQAMGNPVDQRADIYSLGVVLYEMLTGQLLFSGDSPVSVLMKHLHDPVPADWARQYGISPRLAELVNRCLVKNPAGRYQNANQLIGAIEQFIRADGLSLDVGADLALMAEAQSEADTLTGQLVSPPVPMPVPAEPLMPHPPQRRDAPVYAPPPPLVSPVETVRQKSGGFPWMTFAILGIVGLCLLAAALALAYFALQDKTNPTPYHYGFLTPAMTLPAQTPTSRAIETGVFVRPTNTSVSLVVSTPTRTPTLPPPPPTPTSTSPPTATPTTVVGNIGLIELRVQPFQAGLWSVVQWKDGFNNWHNVEGWLSPLQADVQVWEVLPSEYGKGPFRWVVLQGQNGPVVGTSDVFYLPGSAGQKVLASISLATANSPPVIQAMLAQFPEVEVNHPLGLRCVAFDPDGDLLRYSWTTAGGSIAGSGPDVIYTAPGTPGSYLISVLVTDGKEGLAEGQLEIQVKASVAPPLTGGPEGKFGKVWRENPPVAQKMGSSLEEERSPVMSRELFQNGKLLYVGDPKRIYLLLADGRWRAFDDTWDASQPRYDTSIEPPPGFYQPEYGFGKVWREQLRGTSLDPGWATEKERGYTGAAMRFERGQMLWTDERLIYILADDGSWTVVTDTFEG